MKEQLLLLLELQKIDARVHELRAAIEAMPQKLVTARNDLSKLEAILHAEGARLSETEAWRKEQESFIQMEDEAIKKAKIKLQSSRSTKDYSAATREVDNKRKMKAEREEEVLKIMEAIEASRKKLGAYQEDIEALRSKLQQEEASVGEQVAAFEAEVIERSAGREDLVARLDQSLLKRYEQIMHKRGFAVAPVRDGVCQGCHMSIPPQLNNVLARCESIEDCPRCNRLLYRQELLER